MELENGVTVEDEKSGGVEDTIMEGPVVEVKKVKENVDNGEEISNGNEVSENEIKAQQGPTPSEITAEVSGIVSAASKISNPVKAPNGVTSKNNKKVKDLPNSKGTAPFARAKRPSLAQSLSFSARGLHADITKKGIDCYPLKANPKHSRENGAKTEATFSNATVTSVTRFNSASRRTSTGVNSKEANTIGSRTATRRNTLVSVPIFHQSLAGKSISTNGTTKCPPSEVSLSVDQVSEPIKTSLPIKKDDDARSSTSSATSRGQRRSSVSGFSFRLNERAEKRKEFFSKLEEKIQAKEVEKTNLQEKSKESQEAEIKHLRKSLTFKATPMPTFYKDPPPKFELKKIPTTCAISPKLGRHKSSIAVANNSLGGGGSCPSPHVNHDLAKSPKAIQAKGAKDISTSKKLIRKSLSKPHSREPAPTKTETKSGKLKQKPEDAEGQNEKTCVGESKETQNKYVRPHELEGGIKVESEENYAVDNELILSTSNPDITPAEVTVGG